MQNPPKQMDSNSDIISRVKEIHSKLSVMKSLEHSNEVFSLTQRLINICKIPSQSSITMETQLLPGIKEHLIQLAGTAEALLEQYFATYISKTPSPLQKLHTFPYYENYLKVTKLEHRILTNGGISHPNHLAFVGSGPMPLTTILLAARHMPRTHFYNYDVNSSANEAARKIVGSSGPIGRRMNFVNSDIRNVGKEMIAEYDCILLAALAGVRREDKIGIIGHLRKHMRLGGFLLVRSAKGARVFLYPTVEEEDLIGFKTISVHHPSPTDDILNSVFLVQKQCHYTK